MKIFKRTLALMLCLMVAMSIVSIGVEAGSVSTTSSNYGCMVPTDNKFSKTVSTVKLYGTHDYLNFYIDAEYSDKYFFYEIYSDKNYTNLVTGDYVYCQGSGEYTWSPLITLKGVFKSGTYYCVTYAAAIDSSGNVRLSTASAREFKLVVDRTTAFSKQVVVLKGVKNTVNGPQISWCKHSAAASKYVIYRRPINGTSWTRVGTVNASTLTFTDKSVKDKNGKYVYTVKALNKSGAGSRYQFSGLTALFAKAPVVNSVSVLSDNRVQIKWNNTSGSAYYRVYRKTNGGSWEVIKKSYKGTSFIDTTAKSGNNYQYTVRAFINTAQGTATSSYYSGKNINYVASPELLQPVAVDNGVQVNWKASAGATAYTVYRRPIDLSEGWTNLGKVTKATLSFIDETAVENESYIYTVRAEAKGSRGSYFSKGIEYVSLVTPTLTLAPETVDNKVCLTWDEISGATSYDVYAKVGDGDWKIIEVTTDATYTVELDATGLMQFKVQASKDNTFYSEFSNIVEYTI